MFKKNPNLLETESAPKSKKGRIAKLAAGALAAGGAVFAYRAGLNPNEAYEQYRDAMTTGFAPKFIETNPYILDGMRGARDTINIGGPVVAVAGFSKLGYDYAKSKKKGSHKDFVFQAAIGDDFEDGLNRKTRFNRLAKMKRRAAAIGLAATAAAFVGGSSSLEDEIVNGPTRPVGAAVDALSVGPKQAIIVQGERNTFMDDSDVELDKLERLRFLAEDKGINIAPFDKSLPNIDDESGMLLSVPDPVFEQMTGIEIDQRPTTIPVLLDRTNTTSVGESIDINGVSAQVVMKTEGSAQMNRDVAVVAASDYDAIQQQNAETVFGAVASGEDLSALPELMKRVGLDVESVAISKDEFKDHNVEFWEENGTPPIVQLEAALIALGILALAGKSRSELERNVKHIADLQAQGVNSETIKEVVVTRARMNALIATVVAAPGMMTVALIYNASTRGLSVEFMAQGALAGGAVALLVEEVSKRRALNQFDKNVDIAQAGRSA